MPAKLSAFIFFTSLLTTLTSCFPGKFNAQRNITVAFYNVENLFDTINSPGNRDAEFTPGGTKLWNETRYTKKINDLAQVIHRLNPNDLPEIVGLCEVENEQVLADIIQNKHLADGEYQVVHFNSRDLRGIDCALIFRPSEFKLLFQNSFNVHFPENARSVTRDILYVKGYLSKNEELHIFVNHWPSRIGGVEQTQDKRLAAATTLKEKMDSVLRNNPKAHILIMGDMNDEPDNKSLVDILEANSPSDPEAILINLMYPEFIQGKGSYKYRGKWNMLDHLIVSASLMNHSGWNVVDRKGYVFREGRMEYVSPTGIISPFRTYNGSNYLGGISDHFPVYFRLRKN